MPKPLREAIVVNRDENGKYSGQIGEYFYRGGSATHWGMEEGTERDLSADQVAQICEGARGMLSAIKVNGASIVSKEVVLVPDRDFETQRALQDMISEVLKGRGQRIIDSLRINQEGDSKKYIGFVNILMHASERDQE